MSSNLQIPAVCEYCTKDFIAKTTKTRFCNLDCARSAYKKKQREDKVQRAKTKFESRLVITHTELKDKELLTIKEACQLLNITDVTLRRWLKAKLIISSRLGKKHLIKRSHINKLIE